MCGWKTVHAAANANSSTANDTITARSPGMTPEP